MLIHDLHVRLVRRLDVILSAPACENYLQTLVWDGANEFNTAQKQLWKIKPTDRQVAGTTHMTAERHGGWANVRLHASHGGG